MQHEDNKNQKLAFVSDIQGRIISGELKPGARLPSERSLVQEYSISRGAVGQGLVELEKMGFVRIVPRQGVFVSEFRENATPDTLAAIMLHRFDTVESSLFSDLMALRILVERECVRLACKNINTAAILKLSVMTDDIFAAGENISDALYEYHRYIVYLSGNSAYLMVFQSFEKMLRLMMKLRYSEEKESRKCHREYALLSAALGRADADDAVEILDSILNSSARYLNNTLKSREQKYEES